jgi:ABC-type amino acid transport substrate-binding protein
MMVRVLAALALTLVLAETVAAQGPTGTLDKLRRTGTIALGYREQSLPFSFLGPDGKPAGYSIDLCARVVTGLQQQLGLDTLQTRWVAVTPETRMDALVAGTIDLECGSTTSSLSRRERVDFSLMTFLDGGTLLTKAGSGIGGLGDVGGKRIAVIPGTTTDRVLREALRKAFLGAQLVPVKDHREGLAALDGGAADAYASDRVILVGLAATAPDPARYAIAAHHFSYEPYALMMRRGDPDFRLAVDRVLARLYRGEIGSIYSSWFGAAAGESGTLILLMYALQALPD